VNPINKALLPHNNTHTYTIRCMSGTPAAYTRLFAGTPSQLVQCCHT
jgi:hypothetical protein